MQTPATTVGAEEGTMSDRTRKAVDPGTAGQTEPRSDRSFTFSRAPRRRLMALVLCRCGENEVEGYTLNLSYTGILVQCTSSLPTLGERCEISVTLPQGLLRARGQITRVDEPESRFAVRWTHLAKNGYLLLAGFLAEYGTGGRIVLARRL